MDSKDETQLKVAGLAKDVLPSESAPSNGESSSTSKAVSAAVAANGLGRLKREIRALYQDPLPGICVVVDEDDLRRIHALVTGPEGTPYEGGFFAFKMEFPSDYPNNPPKVELQTTDFGRVRFNPNLYACGKVCLSILNTWSGPSWSPAQSISSVLLSIQSIMNSRPYCNEPGFENPRDPRAVDTYNECILHETIRVAFCDMMEENSLAAKSLIPSFQSLIKEAGPSFLEMHEQKCRRRLANDGQPMNDPFGQDRGNFRWASLLERIEKLKETCPLPSDDDDDDDDDDSEDDA